MASPARPAVRALTARAVLQEEVAPLAAAPERADLVVPARVRARPARLAASRPARLSAVVAVVAVAAGSVVAEQAPQSAALAEVEWLAAAAARLLALMAEAQRLAVAARVERLAGATARRSAPVAVAAAAGLAHAPRPRSAG
jgi:hypothetical protein